MSERINADVKDLREALYKWTQKKLMILKK